jgi:DNA-binding transcriptional LysR family regulator
VNTGRTKWIISELEMIQNGSVDKLESMKVFVRVAQRSGFAAAARDLRLSPAQVTKHVAALESRMKTRLFDRTTRRVGLTDAGRVYLERCLECLQAFDDADASISQLAQKPRGLLRITAPVDMPPEFSAVLHRFSLTYPDVTIELRLSNRPVDLVEEGIDVAIRVAPALEGNFVARPLAVTRVGIAASTAYLRKYGRPTKPADLSRHRMLAFTEPKLRNEWTLASGGKQVTVRFDPVFISNNGESLRAAGAAGVAIAMGPSFMLMPDIAAKRMEPLLTDWKVVPELRVFAIYPHRRFLSPKVKALVGALREDFGDETADPWWRS